MSHRCLTPRAYGTHQVAELGAEQTAPAEIRRRGLLRVTIPDDVAERLASEAAERGTSAEDLAADLLSKYLPVARERSLSFVGMFEGVPGALSAAEAERRLEDGEDEEFGQ